MKRRAALMALAAATLPLRAQTAKPLQVVASFSLLAWGFGIDPVR